MYTIVAFATRQPTPHRFANCHFAWPIILFCIPLFFLYIYTGCPLRLVSCFCRRAYCGYSTRRFWHRSCPSTLSHIKYWHLRCSTLQELRRPVAPHNNNAPSLNNTSPIRGYTIQFYPRKRQLKPYVSYFFIIQTTQCNVTRKQIRM